LAPKESGAVGQEELVGITAAASSAVCVLDTELQLTGVGGEEIFH
jgi:hypothetical protein